MRRRRGKIIAMEPFCINGSVYKIPFRLSSDDTGTVFTAVIPDQDEALTHKDYDTLKKMVNDALQLCSHIAFETYVYVSMQTRDTVFRGIGMSISFGVQFVLIGKRNDGSSCYVRIPCEQIKTLIGKNGKWTGVKWNSFSVTTGEFNDHAPGNNFYDEVCSELILSDATVYGTLKSIIAGMEELGRRMEKFTTGKGSEKNIRSISASRLLAYTGKEKR